MADILINNALVFKCGFASGNAFADGELHNVLFVAIGALENAGNLALVHDGDTVTDVQNLLHVAADHEDDVAGVGKLAHKPVNFGFCAYVNAACRFVKNHDARRHGEPFAEDDFLLVAAAEIEHACLDAGGFNSERFHLLLRNLAFAAALDEAEARVIFYRRQRDIFAHGHGDDEAFSTAVFRHKVDAEVNRVAGTANSNRFAADENFFGRRMFESYNGLGHFGTARADEAGEAEDFAARGVERNFFSGMERGRHVADFKMTGRFGHVGLDVEAFD